MLASFHKHCNFACMTTKLFLITICCLTCSSRMAAQNIDSLFAHVPESVCPMLTHSNKLDLLDLYNSHMKAVTSNLYGGQTLLKEKSENFLKLQQTESTDWCMKLYTVSPQSYILVSQTFRTPYPESVLTWYDTQWKVTTPPTGFTWPLPTDFAEGDSLKKVISAWPAHYISATLKANSDSLCFKITPMNSSSTLNRQTRQALKQIALKWDREKCQFVNCPTQK